MKKLIGLGILFFMTAAMVFPAQAEDVSISAEVDTHTIQAGSPVLLMLTVKGTQSVDPVELPEIKGFKARYLGPRRQVSIINGQSETSISFMYNLYGMELGHFQIPAISVTVDNKTYSTQPIEIEVVDQAVINSSAGQNPASVKDKVFMVVSVPTKEYFFGEQIPLTIKLYVNDSEQVNLASNIDFKREGFDIGEIVDSRRYRQTLGEENYNVVEFTTFVYPRKTGELTLGPAQILCKILVQNSRVRGSSVFDMPSVFDDDLFSGFFNSEWRELLVASADIAIKVLPLPDKDKPADFSGAVGKFDFDASVSPAEVKVGDPLTLRMKISGNGSLQNVNFPQPAADAPQFKFYDPQVQEDKEEKSLEQVVIPTTEQTPEFPPLRFTYFDTEKRIYETITKGPFPLKVSPADHLAPPRIAAGLSEAPPAIADVAEEKLGAGISFIKDYPGTFRPVGYAHYKSPGFMAAAIIFTILWLAGFIFYSFQYKLRTDTAFARRFLAPRQARQDLDHARNSLQKGDPKEFYGRLSKTLQNYLSGRFHRKIPVLDAEGVDELLKDRGVKTDMRADIKEFVNECEMVRFALVSVSKEKMEQDFIRVQRVIDHLERQRS